MAEAREVTWVELSGGRRVNAQLLVCKKCGTLHKAIITISAGRFVARDESGRQVAACARITPLVLFLIRHNFAPLFAGLQEVAHG